MAAAMAGILNNTSEESVGIFFQHFGDDAPNIIVESPMDNAQIINVKI